MDNNDDDNDDQQFDNIDDDCHHKYEKIWKVIYLTKELTTTIRITKNRWTIMMMTIMMIISLKILTMDNDCPYNHKKLSIWLKNRHVGWVESPEIFLTKHSKVY